MVRAKIFQFGDRAGERKSDYRQGSRLAERERVEVLLYNLKECSKVTLQHLQLARTARLSLPSPPLSQLLSKINPRSFIYWRSEGG